MHACVERVGQLFRVAWAIVRPLPRIAVPQFSWMPRWQMRWPAPPAEPRRMPAVPVSALLEAVLLCLRTRGTHVESWYACMYGMIRDELARGARDRARSREMHVPVHCKISYVM